MRIICIGDVHGKTDQYQKMLRTRFAGQRTIQVGDMNCGFPDVPDLHANVLRDTHKWIRGNHDSPYECPKTPGYLGDYGYLEEDKLFYLGGAYSIDKVWRIPGKTWFGDEELSYPALAKAIDLYVEKKPRFVVTHECPTRVAEYMLQVVFPGFRKEKQECFGSRTAGALQCMLDEHQPEEWVFGHYHVDTSFTWRATKFTCISELSVYTLTDEPLILSCG